MLGFLSLIPSKTKLYITAGAALLVVLTSALLFYKHQIEKRSLLEFNNRQLQQTITEQQNYIRQMEEMNKIQLETIESLNNRNQDLQTRMQSIDEFLKSEEAKKQDRAASQILKRTIENLKREQR